MKKKEVLYYSVFGVLSTLLNIGLYQILLYAKLNYKQANLITLLVVKLFCYVTNKVFVFHSKTETLAEFLMEFGRFIAARSVTAVIDFYSLIMWVEYLELNKLTGKIVVSFLVIAINYVFSKICVFKKKE